MAYKLTEDNRLIIEGRRLAWILDLILDILAFGLCLDICGGGKNTDWFGMMLLYSAYWMIMFFAYRSRAYSKYVMDEYGITRRFWKYEKFYFWGQFVTKRIEYVPYRVIFSVHKVEEKKWYEDEGLEEVFSPSDTLEFLLEKESILGSDLLYIAPEVFFHKMKEWNVEIEIPWYAKE